MKGMNKQVLRVFKIGIHWYIDYESPSFALPIEGDAKKKKTRGVNGHEFQGQEEGCFGSCSTG